MIERLLALIFLAFSLYLMVTGTRDDAMVKAGSTSTAVIFQGETHARP